jgi:hypothetical protein
MSRTTDVAGSNWPRYFWAGSVGMLFDIDQQVRNKHFLDVLGANSRPSYLPIVDGSYR